MSDGNLGNSQPQPPKAPGPDTESHPQPDEIYLQPHEVGILQQVIVERDTALAQAKLADRTILSTCIVIAGRAGADPQGKYELNMGPPARIIRVKDELDAGKK